jgi:hypothetical protein
VTAYAPRGGNGRTIEGGTVFKRLAYAVFFVFGGFLFAIPKWILMGTKGSRERKRLLKQQTEILKRTRT